MHRYFLIQLLLGFYPRMESTLSPEEKLVLTAMKRENLIQVFGQEAIANAPVFDEELQEYEGVLAAKISNIQFVLYTSDNSSREASIFIGNDDVLDDTAFNKSAPTKVIFHGFMSNYVVGPGLDLNPAYSNHGSKPFNIILVDWSSMAGVHTAPAPKREWYNIFYFPPARNTELVGNQTGILIEFLVRSGARLEDFHLIGHSLGAHAAGWAGRHVESKLGRKIPRITALDPAGPCFESTSLVCFSGNYQHIKKTDAEFVDVVHTHARALGMRSAVGHADFYPNGGFVQPGCKWYTFGQCSHRRAVLYYALSITSPQLSSFAQECSSWDEYAKGDCHSTNYALLGEHCSHHARGIFFLSTIEKSTDHPRII